MEPLLYRIVKQVLVSVVIASLSVCNISVISVAAEDDIQSPASKESDEVQVLLEDQEKETANTNGSNDTTTITPEDPPFVVNDPSVTVDSDTELDGMTMLYIGGAIGVAAIGAIALSGGSSSDSDSGPGDEQPAPPEDEPPAPPVVRPNLNGTNWTGFLDIKNTQAKGYQNIAANIVQRGSSVSITTTSTLRYGRQFDGNISSNGSMLMYDSVTGEDWATHRGNATGNKVDLYDYVNNFKSLDRMFLSR